MSQLCKLCCGCRWLLTNYQGPTLQPRGCSVDQWMGDSSGRPAKHARGESSTGGVLSLSPNHLPSPLIASSPPLFLSSPPPLPSSSPPLLPSSPPLPSCPPFRSSPPLLPPLLPPLPSSLPPLPSLPPLSPFRPSATLRWTHLSLHSVLMVSGWGQWVGPGYLCHPPQVRRCCHSIGWMHMRTGTTNPAPSTCLGRCGWPLLAPTSGSHAAWHCTQPHTAASAPSCPLPCSCCVAVKSIPRCLHFLPREKVRCS